MGEFKEIQGDLIALAKEGKFDVIAHGCNCFCTMGAGIALAMAQEFGCDKYPLEDPAFSGDVNKLGTIDQGASHDEPKLQVINCYTQFNFGHKAGPPVNYAAIYLCMLKINHIFKGKKIGLPLIGCGLAGGDWNIVKDIIKKTLNHCDVTVVHFKTEDDGNQQSS